MHQRAEAPATSPRLCRGTDASALDTVGRCSYRKVGGGDSSCAVVEFYAVPSSKWCLRHPERRAVMASHRFMRLWQSWGNQRVGSPFLKGSMDYH